MPNIPFNMLVSGMRIEEDVFNEGGLKLLPKGIVITDQMIAYLQPWGITNVKIKVDIDEILIEQPSLEKGQEYDNRYNMSIEKTIGFMDGLRGYNKLKIDEIRSVVDEIIQYNNFHMTLDTISRLKEENKYTYQHSINVSIYATFIGRWLNLEKSTLKKLSFAALLHDIGKEKIAKDIIQKPSKLTSLEFNEIKKHPIYGYEIIRRIRSLV